jgi:hypothetical protein
VAVKRLGQNSGGRGLSRAPGSNEKVGVRKPALQNRVLERLRDMLLPYDVIKRLGAVFSGKDRVAHPCTMSAPGIICQRRESDGPIHLGKRPNGRA